MLPKLVDYVLNDQLKLLNEQVGLFATEEPAVGGADRRAEKVFQLPHFLDAGLDGNPISSILSVQALRLRTQVRGLVTVANGAKWGKRSVCVLLSSDGTAYLNIEMEMSLIEDL